MWCHLHIQWSGWLPVYRHRCKFHGMSFLLRSLSRYRSVFPVRNRKHSRREGKESAKKEAVNKSYVVLSSFVSHVNSFPLIMYPRSLSALAFVADFPPAAPKFHQRTHRVRLRNLGTTDKKSSHKIRHRKIPSVH